MRTAGELVAKMGTPNLNRRSLAITTPPNFDIAHSDAGRHLRARELRFPDKNVQAEADSDQIVKAALEDKAMVWYAI